MVTTRSLKEDILQALDAGINDYILKPFTPEVLKEKLNQVTSPASGSA
jgi:two-component system, chemotaxis family, chemotaxis protein CheY